jgi:hypothetical protein
MRHWLLTLAIVSVLPGRLRGQEATPLRADFGADEWLAPDAPITLHFASATNGVGTLAITVGDLDVTALFVHEGDALTYRPAARLLPAGASELIVYQVTPEGQWNELQRFALRLLTAHGFQQASVNPRLDIANEGQIAQENSPPGLSGKTTFQAFNFNTGLASTHVRGGWTLRTQANAVGVTERERALRFAERRGAAPNFDLSDYLISLETSATRLSLGNVSAGSSRHLIQGYAARGLSASVRMGRRADLALAAMAGRPIVGWQKLTGITDDPSRIMSATLGLEAVPQRPGLLRVEGTALDGVVPANAGFTQGAILDVEESRGASLRITGADPTQRLTLDAGFARARFANPADPLLAQGAELVPVAATTRNARYADVGLNLLRGTLFVGLPINATTSFRHERVDPLYRSVATATRADFEQNAVELTGGAGPLNLQLAHTRARDNLDDVASILRTLTRDTRVVAAIPVGALFRASGSALLPQLAYAYGRTHQFGASSPTNGGFDATHIPDQISETHGARLTWQRGAASLAYQLDYSHQNNRQPTRDRADFTVRNHGVLLGFTLLRRFTLSTDVALERARSHETAELTTTHRVGGSVTASITRTTEVAIQAAHSRLRQQSTGTGQRNSNFRVQLSQRFRPPTGTPNANGQLFIRLAGGRSAFFAPDLTRRDPDTWTINTGANLSLF